jgi:histidinol phosphatase-like PHP family hydrolase
MLNEFMDSLVEVVPIEYHKARIDELGYGVTSHHNPRIIRYRDFSFDPHLTKEKLEQIVAKTHMKRRVLVIQHFDRFLSYQYANKPTIILDLLEGKVFTTKRAVDIHGESKCQQQASILMRLLKQHGHAMFRRVTVTANPYRIGYTKEDRDITFKALHRLLGDN